MLINKISEILYKETADAQGASSQPGGPEAAASGAASGGTGGQGSESKVADEDVVDAEYEVEDDEKS